MFQRSSQTFQPGMIRKGAFKQDVFKNQVSIHLQILAKKLSNSLSCAETIDLPLMPPRIVPPFLQTLTDILFVTFYWRHPDRLMPLSLSFLIYFTSFGSLPHLKYTIPSPHLSIFYPISPISNPSTINFFWQMILELENAWTSNRFETR